MDNQIDSFNWSTNDVGGEEERNEFDILLCFRVLLSYWWVLSSLAMIGAAFGWAYCQFWAQPVFRGYCRFEIFQNMMLNSGRNDNYRSSYKPNLWRHILIMKSEKLNAKVREDLNVEWGAKIPNDFNRYRVEISPVDEAPGSMLDMVVDSFDSKYSVEYLSKLIEGYEQMRRQDSEILNSNTLSNLRRELNNLSKELEDVQNQISQFEAKHNIYFVHEKSKSDQALLTALMNHQSKLRSQIAILDAQFPFLDDKNPATLRDVLDLTNQLTRLEVPAIAETGEFSSNTTPFSGEEVPHGWSEIPEWRENESLIMRLNAEFNHMMETYKEGHPKMIALKNRIDAAKRELEISAEISLKRLQSIRNALKMQEKALLETAQDFRMEINLTAGERAEYEKLKARAIYLKEKRRQHDSEIMDGLISPADQYYTRVVEGPGEISTPVWPIQWKLISISILSFVGVGATLILLSYFIQVRLYDFQALEKALGLTCLAGIPRFKSQKVDRKNPLTSAIVLHDKGDFSSECYRSLRTNIEQQLGEDDKVVMVTSPDPGEGKTFTVLNVSIVFSWNRKKVLIIDGDFRRRTFRKLIKDASSSGLTDCLLSDEIKWEDCVSKEVFPNVDYLPAGRLTNRTTELLTLPILGTILEEIKKEYDMILIDSAPVNRVVDTIVLSKYSDCVILMAKAGKTKTHSLRYCYSRLAGNNIIGYILNNIDAASRKYGYYSYGYSYYSTYNQYQGYTSDDPVEEKKVGS